MVPLLHTISLPWLLLPFVLVLASMSIVHSTSVNSKRIGACSLDVYKLVELTSLMLSGPLSCVESARIYTFYTVVSHATKVSRAIMVSGTRVFECIQSCMA